MKLKEYLKKIQNLSLIKRKILFWLILISFGLILCTLWIIDIQRKTKNFTKERVFEELNLHQLEEGMKNIPNPEMPISEIKTELQKLEENKTETE